MKIFQFLDLWLLSKRAEFDRCNNCQQCDCCKKGKKNNVTSLLPHIGLWVATIAALVLRKDERKIYAVDTKGDTMLSKGKRRKVEQIQPELVKVPKKTSRSILLGILLFLALAAIGVCVFFIVKKLA